MTKNKPIYHARNVNRWKGSVPSVINRFIFCHGVVIFFIMQSLLEIRSKNLPCFPSKRENRQSAILFIHRRLKFYVLTHNDPKNPEYLIAIFVSAGKTLDLSIFDNFGAQLQAPVVYFANSRSDSYANKSYEISSLSIHFIVKLNWKCIVVCLRDVVSTFHQMTSRHVTFFYWRRWRVRSRYVQWKSKWNIQWRQNLR